MDALDILFGFLPNGNAARGALNYLSEQPKSETQYSVQSFLSGLSPLHNGLYSYRDNMSYMRDYLNQRGLDWSDIKYPYRTDGWSGGYALGSGVRSVSRNVTSLYGSSFKSKKKRR